MSKSSTTRAPSLAPAHRIAAAAAALTAVVGSLGTLLLAFDGSSPAQWAPSSAELAQGIARCEHERGRAAQAHCKQVLARVVVARAKTGPQLAQR